MKHILGVALASLTLVGCTVVMTQPVAPNARYLNGRMAGEIVMSVDMKDGATCNATLVEARKAIGQSPHVLQCETDTDRTALNVKSAYRDDVTGITFHSRYRTIELCNRSLEPLKKSGSGLTIVEGCSRM